MVTRNRLGPQSVDGPAVAVYAPDPDTGAPRPPSISDPRVPAAPTALSATGSVYQLRGGGYAAAVQLHWTASTTDVDGHQMGQSAVEIWGRKNATGVKWAILTITAGDETDSQLEGFIPGETWQFEVRAVSGMGKNSAYSNIATFKMPVNDPPPLPPSPPSLTTRLGTVSIRWDGKASGGGAMPTDTDHVRVERHSAATFLPATGMVLVDTILPPGGLAVDGPLKVGDVWFYRMIAVDRAGQDSQPSGGLSIKVDGVTGPDLPPEVITPGMLSGQVAQSITDAAVLATSANTAAQNAAKIFSQPTMPTTGMKLGDLWYDTSTAGGNKPYRYAVSGTANAWISVRDLTLSAAFPSGTVLDSSFLAADVVRTKFLQAGLIEAKDILTGTITADSGVIGSLDAGKITFGQMDGAHIKAGTVSANSIFLGDTENLVDEPGFGHIEAWFSGPPQVGGFVTVADLPVSGSGNVYQIPGNATIRTITNSRHVSVAPGDSFYAEAYVRKTATATTGTAQLLLTVKRKGVGVNDIAVPLCSYLFKTTDGANTWVKISTVVSTGTAPNIVTTTGVKIPDLGYDATLTLRVAADVVGGNIQFGAVMLRRQNSGRLIVDGSITSNQITAGTITAGNIGAYQIKANNLDAAHIRADSFQANSILANSAVIGSLDASKITVGFMNAARITAGSIGTTQLHAGYIHGSVITGNTLNADRITSGTITSGKIGTGQIYAINIHAAQITSAMINGRQIKAGNIVSGTITANELKFNSITGDRIHGNEIKAAHLQSNSVTAAKIAAGQVTAVKISSTAIDSKVITGAYIRTSTTTGRRVTLTSGGLSFYSGGNVPLLVLSVASGQFLIRSNSSGSRIQIDNAGIRLYQGSTNTVNLSASGAANFKGTVTAGSFVNSSTISSSRLSGTLSGGTISGSIHSGGGFYGSLDGYGATITGGTVRTSGGANRVQIAGDQIAFYSRGALGGVIKGDVASSALNIYPSGGNSVFIGNGREVQVANGFVWSPAIYRSASTGGAAVYVQSNGFLTRHTSSARYKTNIADLELTSRFMDIRTSTWRDKPTVAAVEHRVNMRGSDRFTGFLAENLHQIGLVDTVVYDKLARPDSISVPSLLAHTVRYAQHLTTRLDELTERVRALEG